MGPFDRIEITSTSLDGKTHQKKLVSIAELAEQIHSDSFTGRFLSIRKIITFNAAAKFVNLITIPAGCLIKRVGFQIIETVVAGGTSVKVGFGQHGSAPSAYGKTADLLKGSFSSQLFNGSVLGAPTDIDICAVTTAGTALGDTNITAGTVLYGFLIEQPTQFFTLP